MGKRKGRGRDVGLGNAGNLLQFHVGGRDSSDLEWTRKSSREQMGGIKSPSGLMMRLTTNPNRFLVGLLRISGELFAVDD